MKDEIGELVGGWGGGDRFVVGVVTEIIQRKSVIVKYRIHWTDGDVTYTNELETYRAYLRTARRKKHM